MGFRQGEMFMASGDHALKVEFIKANPVNPIEESRSPEPKKDKQAARPLGKVTYRDLWDGVTLAYEQDNSGGVKSTFQVKRTGSLNPVDNIRLRYNVPLKLDERGGLILSFPTGQMRESKPEAWQEVEGEQVPVEVGYQIKNEREVGVTSGSYDPKYPLVIVPILSWNTFLGGSSGDYAFCIAVDPSGNINIAGQSFSTWGSPVRSFTGSKIDAFVARLDRNGSLQWHTFLGGSEDDTGNAIALDTNGNIYVTGWSLATWGSPVLSFTEGNADAFTAKLDSAGALLWDTFLGGSGGDGGYSVAVDTSGNVYVGGSSDITWGSPHLPFSEGNVDAFVARLDKDGALQWNTFLGGSDYDSAWAIAVDPKGQVYVAGMSNATWGSPVQPFNGAHDAFVAKINWSGALRWNTFLGGSENDAPNAIAADSNGNVYITGYSYSTWGSPIRPFGGGSVDAFVAKLDTYGSLQWNTFMGGPGGEIGYATALDAIGNVYVAGWSDATWGSPARPYTAGDDAFAAMLNGGNGALQWNTFLGGSGYDEGYGIAVDTGGYVFVAGSATMTWGSPVRPYTAGADAFVAKISDSPSKDDFVGAWPGQGIYYRNSGTGQWVLLETSPSSQITVGDLDGDGIDDLIGIFPNDPGVWAKRSSTNTWLRLDAQTPNWIAVGDMNGDGRVDFLGAWNNGVYYRNSITASWVLMETSAARQVAAGDLDGDGKTDLIGIFPTDPGVWTKKSSTNLWLRLDSLTPSWIAVGDMNGDGRPDLLGTWPGSGVYYRDSATGTWVLLEPSIASQVVAGDLDGDGKKDLIGVFPNDPGVWTKRSSTLTWLRLDALTPSWIAAGRMRAAGASAGPEMSFRAPSGGLGLMLKNNFEDLSMFGPSGRNFTFTVEKNARIRFDESAQRSINPGPGELGFRPIKDEKRPDKKESKATLDK